MESKTLVKSTNNIVTSRFFARTPSRIRRIVKICDVVDLFLRKPFWFFLSIFSIWGSMRLRSRALYILVTLDVRVIPRYFLANPRSPFLGKGKMHPFIHMSIVFWLYTALVSEQYAIELSGLPYFRGYFIEPCCFSIFNFSQYRVEFF